MDGKGSLKTPDFEYVGEFSKGQKHGKGIILWKSG